MSDQIRLYNFSPNKMSEERAKEYVGSVMASAIWRTIEPCIKKDGINFRDLLEECYPDYLGAVLALGAEDSFFNTLGILAHDTGQRVVLADKFGECYRD
jgi:hypothetical protein